MGPGPGGRRGEAARGYRLNKRLPDWWAERARKHTGFLAGLEDPLDLGMDIGRTQDLSVIWLLKRGVIYRPTLAVVELKKKKEEAEDQQRFRSSAWS